MKQTLIDNITNSDIKKLITTLSVKKIFLVTGKSSYERSGSKEFIDSFLNKEEYVQFCDFEQNPKYEDAIRGMNLLLETKCNMIIAIGGGSVIDMAKLINVFAANSKTNSLEIVTNSNYIINKGKPFLAIPTTAGTGSEATHFAVVYHNKKKYSVAHQFILPDFVGFKYSLTFSQSKYLTACAGLDAFSQAIESYWSVGATNESKIFAKNAISLIVSYLEKAVNAPDLKSRKALMKGAYLAGKAINISKTTAAHAVSYAFTTYYNISHGHAVFLTLPEFLVYNSQTSQKNTNDSRGSNYINQTIKEICELLGVSTINEAKMFLTRLAKNICVELSLEKLKINNYESIIIDNVNMERLGNNPRKVSREDLISLLKSKS